MFYEARSFSGSVPFNTTSLETMVSKTEQMTNARLSFASNLSPFSFQEYMFHSASSFTGDGIENFMTSRVTDMHGAFFEARSLKEDLDLSRWDTSLVIDMSQLFYGSNLADGGVGNWQTGSAVTMENMFARCGNFRGDLSYFDVSNVVNFNQMFYGASQFQGTGLQNWNMGSATNTHAMFYGTSTFPFLFLCLSSSPAYSQSNLCFLLVIRNVGATSFNADISEWRIDAVTDLAMMFYRAASFKQNLWRWGDRLANGAVAIDDIFEKSGCAVWTTPNPSDLSNGPWCLLSRDDVAPLPDF